ncbi:MAG TPA: UDP-N-acetylglucosamine--N-acetylmuramyl-(pentapeptide) pyrophosphoryl-undecaprenol N-acetylglucosamine transferase [Candidatus Saccharimonadia bacterium]|nr:UDP-N-acetylglucosamine--N-acetylmuramyl-(pentapeptide) pyrophosphoryl-undecaprenol N-acetylglucosamine transferase [Candidatus Saccharimonadia bacterium]
MSRANPLVVLTGGGSGGHITPLQAVAAELKKQPSKPKLVYIGQKGDHFVEIMRKDSNIDEVFSVRAGKFRRFHGEGFKQLLDIPTLLKNARDFFYVLIGLAQSRKLLKRLQPDVIFIKGGFIGVPVGLAAANLHLPYVTHDSDAIPGLANRIIARWARLHAVALPEEVYNYPAAKTVTTGIPLQAGFEPVTEKLKARYRQEIDMLAKAKMLFAIGGGLGAQRVNTAIAEALPHLLHEFPDLYVVQSVGRANEEQVRGFYEANLTTNQRGRVHVFGYIDDVFRYSGAADIVVTRAGATNLAEFALQGKACVVVPNPLLTGGHQLKNASYLAERQAAVILKEDDLLDDPNRLAKQVSHLLRDPKSQLALAANLAEFAQPDATRHLARLILEQIK